MYLVFQHREILPEYQALFALYFYAQMGRTTNMHVTKNFPTVTCRTLQRVPDKVSVLEKSHQETVTVRLTPVLFAVSYSLGGQARSSLSSSVFTPVLWLWTGKGLTE